jgi:hypothetical protein
MANKELSKDEILAAQTYFSDNKGSNVYVTLESARLSMDKYANQWKVKYDELKIDYDRLKHVATEQEDMYFQLTAKCDALETKYDNILATEDGHESKTENVWQSGYATGHEAGCEKTNHAVRNELQKQFTDNDIKWAKENEKLKERADKMEAALKEISEYTHACGCLPCTGQCASKEALLIEIDGLKEIASNALAGKIDCPTPCTNSSGCIDWPACEKLNGCKMKEGRDE